MINFFKYRFLLLSFFFLLGLTTCNLASTPVIRKNKNIATPIKTEITLRVVDIDKVLEKIQIMTSLEEFIDIQEKKILKKKQQKKFNIVSKQTALEKVRKKMTRKVFEAKKKEIIEESFAMQKNFIDATNTLKKSKKKAEDYIYSVLKDTINTYAKNNNIDVILQNASLHHSTILYAHNKVDISDDIIVEINNKITDITSLIEPINY